jgi:uncharacterized NAD(P)/FAD-binding protein YdhS
VGKSRMVGLMVLVVVIASTVACGGDSEDNAVATRGPTELNKTQENRAIRDLTDEGEVLEAKMAQTATTASLDLVVVDAVSEERAKELGSKFVRVVKQRGPDRQTGVLIGIGNVDYTITVSYSDGNQVAQGTKARNANAIVWK